MALKPTHWLLATILVCCTMAVAFLPPTLRRQRDERGRRHLETLGSLVVQEVLVALEHLDGGR